MLLPAICMDKATHLKNVQKNYSHAVVDITWWKFLGTYLPGLFHVWFLVPVAESLTDVGIHGT